MHSPHVLVLALYVVKEGYTVLSFKERSNKINTAAFKFLKNVRYE